MYKGIALAAINRHEDAIEALDKSLASNPSLIDALICRSGSLFALGRFSETIETDDRILSLNPTLIDIWMQKGNSLFEPG